MAHIQTYPLTQICWVDLSPLAKGDFEKRHSLIWVLAHSGSAFDWSSDSAQSSIQFAKVPHPAPISQSSSSKFASVRLPKNACYLFVIHFCSLR